MDLPLPLARPFHRVLGQSLHAPQGDLGLLAKCPLRVSHPDRRNGAARSGVKGLAILFPSNTSPLRRSKKKPRCWGGAPVLGLLRASEHEASILNRLRRVTRL